MILIRTHFLAATNTKPARMIADDGRGHKALVSYDHEFNPDFNCERAALTLSLKMNWGSVKYAGTYKEERFYNIVK